MEKQELNCCCSNQKENCIVCGKPLVYFKETKTMTCAVCHKRKPANAACEDGHFLCDDCHAAGGAGIISYLEQSKEKDPIALYMQVCAMESVHLHGPEHHSIVPCVLVTAYHNGGGDIEFPAALYEAWTRGKKIPGGACGFLGVCGAAAGAGVFASIVSDVTPLTGEVWDVPQRLTMECLRRMTEVGGPRCCKRTGRLAIEAAVDFVCEHYGVDMPVSKPWCTYSRRNRECLHGRCPFYAEAE